MADINSPQTRLPITAKESGAVVGRKRKAYAPSVRYGGGKRKRYVTPTPGSMPVGGEAFALPVGVKLEAVATAKEREKVVASMSPSPRKWKRRRRRKARDDSDDEDEDVMDEDSDEEEEEEVDEDEEDDDLEAEGIETLNRLASDTIALDSVSEDSVEQPEEVIIPPLSGRSFVKENLLVKVTSHHFTFGAACSYHFPFKQPPHQPIRTVETFLFSARTDSFVFRHRFWRGDDLQHKCDVLGGTFALLDVPDVGDRAGGRTGGMEGPANEKQKEKGKEEGTRINGTHVQYNSESHGRAGASHIQKVILHWPPSCRHSQDWRRGFGQQYSHLFLVHPRSAESAATFQEERYVLLSKHNAVFVQN